MKMLEAVENSEESDQDESELDYDAVIEDRLDRLLARLEDDWNFVINLQNVSIVIKSYKTQWLSKLSIYFTCLFCRFVILVS